MPPHRAIRTILKRLVPLLAVAALVPAASAQATTTKADNIGDTLSPGNSPGI
jgi:hypothetical protein